MTTALIASHFAQAENAARELQLPRSQWRLARSMWDLRGRNLDSIVLVHPRLPGTFVDERNRNAMERFVCHLEAREGRKVRSITT